ncbi:MAG TPA: hypothetical protein VMS65_16340 [Polyangiaceae bacterium]|nr:hypothetical protein [Polyangiaceae bacterium]
MNKPRTLIKDDDAELDHLLARGRLSGSQYDQIERRVLDQVAPKRRVWPLLAPAAALAAAFCLWIAAGRDLAQAPGAPPGNAFREKSGGTPTRGVVSIGCGGANPLVCRPGDTLMFSVSAVANAGYLVAYAERVGDPKKERIWYFPRTGATAPRVEAQAGTAVLPQGVRLGPPHVRGQYRVRAWLSEEPATRAQLEGASHDEQPGITLEIVD